MPPRTERRNALRCREFWINHMSFSTLPLSYCTNVHAGRTVSDVVQGLDQYTVPVRERIDQPLAAGLWLANSVVTELLSSPGQLEAFRDHLQHAGLSCHTLNAFPFGDFHSDRVKEQVYLPDWTDPARLQYTQQCAQVLASLLPDGTEGSISTVPLGAKLFDQPEDFQSRCIANLIELSQQLDELHDDTGRVVRLAIEPEPFCVLEQTSEAIAFFAALRGQAADVNQLTAVNRHIGLCYDICHQSVEFEDVAESIRALSQADIRINKVHITCAIQLDNPAENSAGREALAKYVEPRYLHQTFAQLPNGQIVRQSDLTRELTTEPDEQFAQAATWRVHFHVPVDAETLGPLGTTRGDVKRALAVVAELSYAPHLEVETYTWEVLPGGDRMDLIEGLSRELTATQQLLQGLSPEKSSSAGNLPIVSH